MKVLLFKIYKNLKLNAIEICILKDMKRAIYKFCESIADLENDVESISLLSPHKSRNILNEFFKFRNKKV
ncbi:hypothetical protein [Borreliella burgdorferi]|uniref:Uncharacterized protein n=4 Tax=Borreliella TaxID=64895 RepID=A0ACD5GLA5_9SPIR|nr:hypothetical protein [Borreliella burgdorferi]PRQ93521.1 hypothetical protein CV682_05060 [Borreliella burgdorferi]PRQ94754.1 hypothetical protein CV688_05755 [Borreliella burgdorferi]PRR02416.1 hypothetical protein CV669_05715 [Borreliella burgdorferi]PRR07328.1 hypothetical protein CV677_05930 [Borreliella burgdorferi]PRR13341.1 hypothetical protein CV655_05685 [Borreliella burgdorferi]